MGTNKKQQVIEELYRICHKNKDYVFHNDMVKKICSEIGFGNPFDVTKLDNKFKLPKILRDRNIGIVHIGNGNHRFIKGLDKLYHDFEPIQKTENWEYQKSLLNQYNSSESNLLSIANNQRILHHFLFSQDSEFNDVNILLRPKTYFPHRTKTSFKYCIGNEIELDMTNIQIEIDLTIEFQGNIGVFEAKNGQTDNFSIYQLYHPFLYYYNANKQESLKGKIKNIYGVYVVREKKEEKHILKLWAYTFSKPFDMTSIKFVKSTLYNLIQKEDI